MLAQRAACLRLEFLKDNIHEIYWHQLSANANAIPLLEQYKDKIDWTSLSTNPSIFKEEPIPTII